MNIGERVKQCIDDKDFKQKNVAQKIGISPQSLNNYIQNVSKFPVQVLMNLAKALDVSMDYLVGFTEDEHPPMDLTESERNLMTDFRTLTKAQKELIAANVRLMKEQNKR